MTVSTLLFLFAGFLFPSKYKGNVVQYKHPPTYGHCCYSPHSLLSSIYPLLSLLSSVYVVCAWVRDKPRSSLVALRSQRFALANLFVNKPGIHRLVSPYQRHSYRGRRRLCFSEHWARVMGPEHEISEISIVGSPAYICTVTGAGSYESVRNNRARSQAFSSIKRDKEEFR